MPKGPLVEIQVVSDRAQFIGEQNIILKAFVIFHQYVNPFWEEITKIDFSPFRVEKAIIGERKMFDRDKDLSRDFREITFLLSLPASSACGQYTIPSFSLGYSYFKEKKEIREAVKSEPFVLSKAPILISYELEKDVVTIGEVNTFRLSIWREKYIQILNYELKNQNGGAVNLEREEFERWLKSLETRGQKISDLNRPSFPNFKILAKKSWSEAQGRISKEVFEYRFSFYELGGKEFPTPDFHIWYLDRSQEEKSQKPKEIIVPPLAVHVNLMVREGRQLAEGLKPTQPTREKGLYYLGYGPLALGGLGFLLFVIIVSASYFRPQRKSVDLAAATESIFDVRQRLLRLLKPNITDIDRQVFIKTRNEFFKLLAVVLQIPTQTSSAKTSSEILTLFAQRRFSENFRENLKITLKLLDTLIQTGPPFRNFDKICAQINVVLSAPEIAPYFKKRKKFIIF